jgi:hypothetical protein
LFDLFHDFEARQFTGRPFVSIGLECGRRPHWEENPGMQETESTRKSEADVRKLFIQTIPSSAVRKMIEYLTAGSKTYSRRKSTAKEGEEFSLKLTQESFPS